MPELVVKLKPVDCISPYALNAKKHPDSQWEAYTGGTAELIHEVAHEAK